ncbi:type I glyceraldehyde-3-phosphate dehydrogenase [Candidatus Dojkabacteria bacterium]|uniref:NAD-dependent glyceraldehyde-3-phosphate dehydrogenase n=1 Tax=Candidatus Dojkabacteria bacterium TaxID=2099670 RepID=A0A955LB89_9BACT|nr:type I glyceraldehyde-3-phosphate dehydrogenase [Candidatus Dojkabacteria bacterium]
MTRVAINGFGRIGRLVYRALLEKNFLNGQVEVVVVNDLVPADNLAYLLKYDSNHGMLHENISAPDANTIMIGERVLKTISMKSHPSELPWKDWNIDIVIESTGLFTKNADASGHISAGARKVIISAPSDDETPTHLVGINAESTGETQIISNASCTTNCVAPVVRVLQQSGIGIEEGFMTTLHAYTSTQGLQDEPSAKDWRRGRAAAENIVPSSTGATKAIGKVYPELNDKLTGMAFRVPVKTGSCIDFTFRSIRDTSVEEINAKMKEASESYLQGVLRYTTDPIVSTDIIHDSHSAIFDATSTLGIGSRFFKLVAWYDNEWGYSNRIVEMLSVVG